MLGELLTTFHMDWPTCFVATVSQGVGELSSGYGYRGETAALVAAFFWAVRTGQYDDLESPAWRILLDDDRAPPTEEDEHSNP